MSNLYETIQQQAILKEGITSQVAQTYVIRLTQKRRVQLIAEQQNKTDVGVRIRIVEITGIQGSIDGLTTDKAIQPYSQLQGRANTIYLLISCDQATNIYNSEGKNSPIIAIAKYSFEGEFMLVWQVPFEIAANTSQLTFRCLQPSTAILTHQLDWIEGDSVKESYKPATFLPSSTGDFCPLAFMQFSITTIQK